MSVEPDLGPAAPSLLAIEFAQAVKAGASSEVKRHVITQLTDDDAEASTFVATLALLVADAHDAGARGIGWDEFIRRVRRAVTPS